MSEDAVAVLIPIVVIIMSLSIPIVSANVDYRRRRDIVEAHDKERMGAIERGMTRRPCPRRSSGCSARTGTATLLTGTIWTFVGLGLLSRCVRSG